MFEKYVNKWPILPYLITAATLIFWALLLVSAVVMSYPDKPKEKVWTVGEHQFVETIVIDADTSIYEREPVMTIQIEEIVYQDGPRVFVFGYHKSYMYLVVHKNKAYNLREALEQGILTEDEALEHVPGLTLRYLED